MAPLSPAPASASCGGGYYTNVDHDCVESPDYNPGIRDRDGTNSHSEHGARVGVLARRNWRRSLLEEIVPRLSPEDEQLGWEDPAAAVRPTCH